MEVSNIVGIIGMLIAFVGLFLVVKQLRSQLLIAAADFALRLDDKISLHQSVYKNFFPDGDWYNNEVPKDKMIDVENYLTFFDTLYHLIETDIVSLGQFNRMFGYRFLMTMHNPSVHDILEEKKDFWQDIFYLYNELIAYRDSRGLSIPRPEHHL